MEQIQKTLLENHRLTNQTLLTWNQGCRTSGDGYVWKYLYTIKPSEIVKFDSIEYIPVPENWGTSGESISTKSNAIQEK